ncbi:hypothetical protein ACFXKX_18135 [Streptomyces scopuliridis]|uniref:hypothetical protein n=1 Tax=Streptomyces scopuliridis TaxID=452529 RepID=UPI0036AE2BC1
MREVHVPPVWTDAGAFVGEVPGWFRLDRTRGQEHVVYVAAEKDTLRQLPTDWLADLGIPVLVVRGFGSQSYVDVVRERTATCIRTGRDWRVAAEELGLFIVWLKFGSKPVTGIERPVGNGLVYPGPGPGPGAGAGAGGRGRGRGRGLRRYASRPGSRTCSREYGSFCCTASRRRRCPRP